MDVGAPYQWSIGAYGRRRDFCYVNHGVRPKIRAHGANESDAGHGHVTGRAQKRSFVAVILSSAANGQAKLLRRRNSGFEGGTGSIGSIGSSGRKWDFRGVGVGRAFFFPPSRSPRSPSRRVRPKDLASAVLLRTTALGSSPVKPSPVPACPCPLQMQTPHERLRVRLHALA